MKARYTRLCIVRTGSGDVGIGEFDQPVKVGEFIEDQTIVAVLKPKSKEVALLRLLAKLDEFSSPSIGTFPFGNAIDGLLQIAFEASKNTR